MAIKLLGSVAKAKGSSTSTGTANHTLVAGNNRLLLITVTNVNNPGRSGLVLGTYGGVSPTQILYHYNNTVTYDTIMWTFYIKEANLPANGSHSISGTWSSTGGNQIFVSCFSGVEQSTFPAASTGAYSNSTNLTVSAGASIYMGGAFTANPPTGWTAGSSFSKLDGDNIVRNGTGIGVIHGQSAGSVTGSWTGSGTSVQTYVTHLVEMEKSPERGGMAFWFFENNPLNKKSIVDEAQDFLAGHRKRKIDRALAGMPI